MSGFVDVSYMSDAEIRHMNRIDEVSDYDRRFSKQVRKPKQVFCYSADDVWNASSAAYRINGDYVKYSTDPTKPTNRELVVKILSDLSLITKEDIEVAEKARTYFRGLTFKILKGKQLTEFEKSALEMADKQFVADNFSLSVICSLIHSYFKSTNREQIDQRIEYANGGFIGQVGNKITLNNVEVLKYIFSQTWRVYFITCITEDDQVIFFSYKDSIDSGKMINVQGTVKAHKDNSTQLNRVKVI